jgi:hypothetical protein
LLAAVAGSGCSTGDFLDRLGGGQTFSGPPSGKFHLGDQDILIGWPSFWLMMFLVIQPDDPFSLP